MNRANKTKKSRNYETVLAALTALKSFSWNKSENSYFIILVIKIKNKWLVGVWRYWNNQKFDDDWSWFNVEYR